MSCRPGSGISFKDIRLLQLALVHSSFAFERMKVGSHNETQEFLGDAVLDLTLGYILFTRFPGDAGGQADPDSGRPGQRVRPGRYGQGYRAWRIICCWGMGRRHRAAGKSRPFFPAPTRQWSAALFLDGGYDEALAFVRRWFEPLIEKRYEAAAGR